MKIEILMATMFFEKEQEEILSEINLQSDIMVGNQCNKDGEESFLYNGHKVQVLSKAQRGVGNNRNMTLLKSDADVVIFADNDVVYYDGYREIVENFYISHPDADLVIFNFKEQRPGEPLHDINTKDKKADLLDLTVFGCWAITARRKSLMDNNILFSTLFGGGAKYSCGEDSLFLFECHRKGLSIYLCSETIGQVIHKDSTWFKGINEKFILDRGAFLTAFAPKLSYPLAVADAVKSRKRYSDYGGVLKVVKTMFKGIDEYKRYIKTL